MRNKFNDLVSKVVYQYISRKLKVRKLHPVRHKLVRNILEWCQDCEPEILLARLEHELSSWKMRGFWLFSPPKEQSELYRDLTVLVRLFNKNYGQDITKVFSTMRDTCQEKTQVLKSREEFEKKIATVYGQLRERDKELDAIKQGDRSFIDW